MRLVLESELDEADDQRRERAIRELEERAARAPHADGESECD